MLIRTWQLPEATFGADCPTWFDPGCLAGQPSGIACNWSTDRQSSCEKPRLRLEDAARGMVTYVLDDRVHVFRLADGVDAVVNDGTVSRFTSSGLVYADGARVHSVPFDRLPLRSSGLLPRAGRAAFTDGAPPLEDRSSRPASGFTLRGRG